MFIDWSVYPDLDDPPEHLSTLEDRADYVHRVCSAWDFNITPDPQTFDLFEQWKDAFDAFPLVTSPAWHTFRAWFGWERVPVPPGLLLPEPIYVILDRQEDRTDPCEHQV